MIEKAHDEMMESKEKMDMERARQETELQQRLSERKRKRMEEEVSNSSERDKESIYRIISTHS